MNSYGYKQMILRMHQFCFCWIIRKSEYADKTERKNLSDHHRDPYDPFAIGNRLFIPKKKLPDIFIPAILVAIADKVENLSPL